MKIVKQSYEILSKIDGKEMLKSIERAGRTCYKSEDQITDESAEKFIKMLVERGHESVLEHEKISILFVCDRGVSHEIVRHRIASFSQESTRYVSSVDNKQFIVNSEFDVIEKYESGCSMKRVSDISDGKYSEWEVYKILDKNDIPRRSTGNTGIINHDYFDKIDTIEKAYLLGMIQADGNIKRDSYQITITQHKNNSWYLQRMIRNFVKKEVQRNDDGDCHNITFVSKQMCESLISKGVVPCKSKEQTKHHIDLLWESIPRELIPHFLRGFLDGDGCVRFFKQKNKGETDSCYLEWTGNEHLLVKISEWLVDNFGYVAKVKKDPDANNFYRLYVTKPLIADQLVKKMLGGFVFPYGHPQKTTRMIDRVGGQYPVATWGDSKFKVIAPSMFFNNLSVLSWLWAETMDVCEDSYRKMREIGATPQQARSVLPNSLKTEIVVTANIREWRTIFKQRTAKVAHPQMRELMCPLLDELKTIIPVVFNDITY